MDPPGYESSLCDICNKWNKVFEHEVVNGDHIKSALRNLYKISNNSKLRSFQYRLIHHALVMNAHLYRWKLKNSNLCTFCHKKKETVSHVYGECVVTNDFLKAVLVRASDYTKEPPTLNQCSLILNNVYKKPTSVGNAIILLAKQYIYKKKCSERTVLEINEFVREIKQQKNIEKYIAIKNGHFVKHLMKWETNCSDGSGIREISIEDVNEFIVNQTLPQ